VTSGDEQRALANLAELLRSDLSRVEPADLVRAIKDAELIGDAAPAWSGRLIAMLYRKGTTWSEIVKLTGLAQTTAYRRAEPYL
jgi:hypothetical protein